MLKLLFLIVLVYISFRLFSPPKMIDKNKDYLQEEDNEEFTEYEEIE